MPHRRLQAALRRADGEGLPRVRGAEAGDRRDDAVARREPAFKYADRPDDFVAAAGVRLHVRDRGPRRAPPVVLVHGFGASLHTFDAWSDDLARDHRVVRFDLPGAGLTGADPTGRYTDERGLEVLVALLDALKIRRAHVVGHSFGGRLAWKLAALHPERVDRLVLIAPDGFASLIFRYGRRTRVPFIFHVAQRFLPRSLVRMALMQSYGDPRKVTPDLVERYFDLLRAPGVREASLARLAQTVLEPPEPLLRTIAAPTLLLWGERDTIIPPTRATDFLRAIPDARLVRLAGVGHLPHEEAPKQSLAAVRRFLG